MSGLVFEIIAVKYSTFVIWIICTHRSYEPTDIVPEQGLCRFNRCTERARSIPCPHRSYKPIVIVPEHMLRWFNRSEPIVWGLYHAPTGHIHPPPNCLSIGCTDLIVQICLDDPKAGKTSLAFVDWVQGAYDRWVKMIQNGKSTFSDSNHPEN